MTSHSTNGHVTLNGHDLTLEQVEAIARGRAQATLADDARTRMTASREVIEELVANDHTVYGVTTGFGALGLFDFGVLTFGF